MYRMEISEIILSQSLLLINSSTSHDDLTVLLQKLETYTVESLLNVEEIEDLKKNDNKIRELVTNAIFLNPKSEEEKITELSQILFTSKTYLKTGISNAETKQILLFLSVNCYLRVNIIDLLTEDELSESQTQPLSDNILKLLQAIKIETMALPNAPYHEKKIMSDSNEGFANDNIKQTYNLFESIERGGRGFHFNFMLENLISFLYQLSFPTFIKGLSALNNPQSFVFYLQSLEKIKLLQLANETSLENKWLNFELIRQIVEKENRKSIESTDCLAIRDILARIHNNDFEFFKQTVIYFKRSSLFSASLGDLLISLANSEINNVVIDCFEIDRYNSYHEEKNSLLSNFMEKATEEQQQFLLSAVYDKWNSYFNSLFTTNDFYLYDILLTDFGDFIASYYTMFVSDEDLIKQTKDILSKIKYIDSEWSKSESNQLTKFHLYYSKFYLLSYAFRDKSLIDKEIVYLFKTLKENKIQTRRYFHKREQNPLDIIESNLGCDCT